jgi:hypothetical protein
VLPLAVLPTRQPSHETAGAMAASATVMLTRDNVLKRVSVPLYKPLKARPTRGNTGPPHPASVHGPVVNPRILVAAPATPAGRAAFAPSPHASPCRRRYDQSAK